MTFYRPFLALAVVLSLMAAPAQSAKAKKKAAGTTGTIVSVVKDNAGDKDSGTITIKTTAGKKKKAAAAPAGEEKKFKFDKNTVVEKVAGKKGNVTAEAAKIDDLAAGTSVSITADGDKATKVSILAGKKKKKAAN